MSKQKLKKDLEQYLLSQIKWSNSNFKKYRQQRERELKNMFYGSEKAYREVLNYLRGIK